MTNSNGIKTASAVLGLIGGILALAGTLYAVASQIVGMRGDLDYVLNATTRIEAHIESHEHEADVMKEQIQQLRSADDLQKFRLDLLQEK